MTSKPLRVLSNLPRLEKGNRTAEPLEHEVMDPTGEFVDAWRIFWRARKFDVLLVDITPRFLYWYCLLRWLIPGRRPCVVSVDLLLSQPRGWAQRLFALVRRTLLRKVDLFIHYFQDLSGYERYFGIGPDRSRYVPFKVNQFENLPAEEELSSDGDYVLTSGRSMRDFGTFMEAMKRTGLPGVLLYHDPKMMSGHGTWIDELDVPGNVQPTEDDGTFESFVRFIQRAKLVVIPLQPDCIRAIGVSMYVVAMALKKCVIISECPATSGIISDQAVVVPPCDPQALADAIQRAWDDDEYRERIASHARQYAVQLGGEERLYADFLKICRDLACSQADSA